jgi:hypothetical protein
MGVTYYGVHLIYRRYLPHHPVFFNEYMEAGDNLW